MFLNAVGKEHFISQSVREMHKVETFTFHGDTQMENIRPISMGTLTGVVPTVHWCQTGQVEKHSAVLRHECEPGVTPVLEAFSVFIQQTTASPGPLRVDLTHYE